MSCNIISVICIVISGLVADIDIESEKYRWMGSARIDFYVCYFVYCLLFNVTFDYATIHADLYVHFLCLISFIMVA